MENCRPPTFFCSVQFFAELRAGLISTANNVCARNDNSPNRATKPQKKEKKQSQNYAKMHFFWPMQSGDEKIL